MKKLNKEDQEKLKLAKINYTYHKKQMEYQGEVIKILQEKDRKQRW